MNKKILISFCLLISVVICFGFFSGKSKTQAEAATANEKHYKCITIEENATLWSIAREYYTEEYDDYEDYIDEVRFINKLSDDTIYRGATLVIPYYSAPL